MHTAYGEERTGVLARPLRVHSSLSLFIYFICLFIYGACRKRPEYQVEQLNSWYCQAAQQEESSCLT